ncbi:hypothetical protein ACIRQP_42280 [Streptomyces sp. NPDC102274]|uniref:hypothetical protein n=1 Tax=Streptomyces sp. NPDC102274 TaxID=3366151 RepID=UPI0038073C15
MAIPNPLTDEEVAKIEEPAAAATSGPWHVRQLDNDFAMSLVAISTVPDTAREHQVGTFPCAPTPTRPRGHKVQRP